MSPGITVYEAGTSLDWDGDTKVYLFNLQSKTASVLNWNESRFKKRTLTIQYANFGYNYLFQV